MKIYMKCDKNCNLKLNLKYFLECNKNINECHNLNMLYEM